MSDPQRKTTTAEPAPKKRRRRAPRQLRFTREGRVFVVVTLGVGAAAVNTGNNLLYLVLGLMLSLIVLSGVMSEVVLRHVSVERRLPSRAFAGSACLVEIVLTNHKIRFPSYSIEVEDLADAPTDRRCYFLKVAPNGEQVAAYRRTPERRGKLAFTGFRVATRYPFGLFEKSRVIDAAAEMVVYPALAKGVRPPPADRHLGGETPASRLGPGTEIVGLRDLRDGDEARAIHWRRSAALSRIVVRERQRDTARRLTLRVDNERREPSDAWSERFELDISQTAAVAARALSEGAAVEIVTASGASPLVAPARAPDPLWRFLALLEPVEARS